MKAAVLTGLGQIRVREVPEPRLQNESDVLLRTERVGVCGSDIHYFSEGGIGDQIVSYPFRVGHEFSATVIEVGPAVKRVQAGDRVAVDPAMSCGRCRQCRCGRSHTCKELIFLGCPGQAEGCLSEYIVMPEECCYPVPDTLSLEEAALVEPLSIGMYAVKLAASVKGARVGILGCGPIGLCVLLPTLAEGASAAYVTDKIEERLDVARSTGAAWAGNPLRQDIVAEISDREPELLDLVFECCGQQEALDQAIELLKPGGKLMIIGIPERNRISFDINAMRRKEIAVQNVRRQNRCMQPAIDFIARGHDVRFMITHHFSLAESQEAFELVAGYRDGVVKAIVSV